MKILFTSPIIEHPAAGGPQLRIENSIKALSRVADIYIISRAGKNVMGGQVAEDFYRRFCKEFLYSPSVRGLSGNRYIRKMQSILRNLFGAILEDANHIINYAEQNDIRIVWFGYGNISFPLIKKIRELRPDLKLICDTDSIWSRFVLREVPYIKSPLRRRIVERRGKAKEQEERAWVELCNITTAVSEVDAAYYRSISAHPERIQVFSNVIDIESYKVVPSPPPGLKRPYMYLAGSFGHHNSPMDTAARWVLEEVYPRVQKSIPDIHFYIVGRGSDRTLGHVAGPSITVTGKLPSVLPYLCHADVSLVPLKFESGTRFKILEAAACNVPIVSTVLGAEGLPVEHDAHVLMADEPEQFADAIVELILNKSKAKQLAANCLEVVKRGYSVDHLENEARGILEKLNN